MIPFILDDQLDVDDVLGSFLTYRNARRLQSLRPEQHILDDRVPSILRTLKEPTFLTIDGHFWNRKLCHTGYGIVYFAIDDDKQEQIPEMLRNLLRLHPFATRAERMGKVVRVRPNGVDYWEFGNPIRQSIGRFVPP